MKSNEPKRYAGIDYGFRPESLWAAAPDPLTAILRNVKGRNRQEMVRDDYAAGKLDPLSDELLGGLSERRAPDQPGPDPSDVHGRRWRRRCAGVQKQLISLFGLTLRP